MTSPTDITLKVLHGLHAQHADNGTTSFPNVNYGDDATAPITELAGDIDYDISTYSKQWTAVIPTYCGFIARNCSGHRLVQRPGEVQLRVESMHRSLSLLEAIISQSFE